MADLSARFHNARTKLFRRHSLITTSARSSPGEDSQALSPTKSSGLNSGGLSSKLKTPPGGIPRGDIQHQEKDAIGSQPANSKALTSGHPAGLVKPAQPTLTLEEPTPTILPEEENRPNTVDNLQVHSQALPPTPWSEDGQSHPHAHLDSIKGKGIQTPLSPEIIHSESIPDPDYFGHVEQDSEVAMVRRKIWIKRPGASATLVQVAQDDMVDDVRDMVLRKYQNSIGRTFDAPDVVVRIVPRERSQQASERTLNPEESICRVLESYFPGGQSVDEALLIDVPHKRTPRHSPRIAPPMNHYFEENRPVENEGDYFPPMPAVSPQEQHATASQDGRPAFNQPFHGHAMSIVETGSLPPLPSPFERKNHHRPKYGRQHTSSPTIITTASQKASGTHHPSRQLRPPMDSDLKHSNHTAPTPPPLPSPTGEGTTKVISTKATSPPLDRISSPRPPKPKRARKTSIVADSKRPQADGRRISDKPPTYAFLEGVVPPINVLIVEDNPINLRLLEMFAKRLKVRWQTAMNGRDAVIKWRTGGFHLVLMDIQLPIMSGLEATKEIRRLERVNGIGVFAKSEGEDISMTPRANGSIDDGAQGDDKLVADGIFKSPVIIVALTASSLQSDRHEALAAGCNDFLTKPVSFVWLERKIMEWGCMQALIDFDGWRKWKGLAAEEEKAKAAGEDPAAKARREKKEAKRASLLSKMGQG